MDVGMLSEGLHALVLVHVEDEALLDQVLHLKSHTHRHHGDHEASIYSSGKKRVKTNMFVLPFGCRKPMRIHPCWAKQQLLTASASLPGVASFQLGGRNVGALKKSRWATRSRGR